MRLFVSVDLPDDLASAVADLQAAFEGTSGLNVTDPEQAHVTLKFLGDAGEERLPELERELAVAVEEAGVDPFRTRFEGLGVFPDIEYISVVWLGVSEGSEELAELHEAIEERTTAMGFEAEPHEFTPHVTLARMDHAGGKKQVQTVVREREPIVGEACVGAVNLTESRLEPDGPVYETVRSFEL